MTATLLKASDYAPAIKTEIDVELTAYREKTGRVPALVIVQVGADDASKVYVRSILRSFEGTGMKAEVRAMEADATPIGLRSQIEELNCSDAVDGVIVQMPLPPHLPQEIVTRGLSPDKDVDGITVTNAGLLFQGAGSYFAPATPAGGMELLKRAGVDLRGKRAVVVGRSNIVGRPMALLMLHQHATVTMCHSRTKDLPSVVRQGEVVVAAVGAPGMITGDFVAPGAVVVDFGINVVDGKVVGDVDFASVSEVAAMVTPVPGGTGPMTNLMLLRNTLRAAKLRLDTAADNH